MSIKIIDYCKKTAPKVTFEPGGSFYWSPKQNKITYNNNLIDSPIGTWALLHELAHARLGHINYRSDLGLLKLEVEAWDEALKYASELGIKIDGNHVQDCLDTYRDWLHRRSSCPNCNIICLQATNILYKCHNCKASWTVSSSRFCRPYRLKQKEPKNKKSQLKTATFH